MYNLVSSVMEEDSGTLGKLLNVFIFYTDGIHHLSHTFILRFP